MTLVFTQLLILSLFIFLNSVDLLHLSYTYLIDEWSFKKYKYKYKCINNASRKYTVECCQSVKNGDFDDALSLKVFFFSEIRAKNLTNKSFDKTIDKSAPFNAKLALLII